MDSNVNTYHNGSEAPQETVATLLEISLGLNGAADEQAVLDIVRFGLADDSLFSASLLYIDLDEAGQPAWGEFVATWQREGEVIMQPGMRIYLPEFPFSSISLKEYDHPQLIGQVETEPRIDETLRQMMQTAGIGAIVVVPLVQAGLWVGVLMLVWQSARTFTTRENAFYGALPAIMTPAVASRRLMVNLERMVEERTEALRRSEEYFRSLITNASDILTVLEADGSIRYQSPSFERGLGYTLAEVAGKPALEFMHPDDIPAVSQALTLLAQQPDQSQSALYRWRHKDGSWRFLESVAVNMLGNPAVSGIVASSRDITERLAQQEERDRLQQQIIEAQKQALQELSTPIIPIMDRIIVMPLVGAIDTGRSRDIMRSLLEGISLYRAQIAILDITGVPIVDSGVADHLNRTMQAARLKGAQTIITGVSDAVAETIVDLGIDWSGVEVLRDLQSGLVTALERLGMRLSRGG